MNFDFSASSLIAGFIFSVFGYYIFRYGGKQLNPWHRGIGLALMIYPYFISSVFLLWALGILGLGLAYVKR